jgi:hypothetical protein
MIDMDALSELSLIEWYLFGLLVEFVMTGLVMMFSYYDRLEIKMMAAEHGIFGTFMIFLISYSMWPAMRINMIYRLITNQPSHYDDDEEDDDNDRH